MKKVYVKPSMLAQEIDTRSLLANSPTLNPYSDLADIDNALAGEDFGLGDGDDDTSWGWNGTW